VWRRKIKSMSRKIWTQMADEGQNPLYKNALCPDCEDVNLVKMIPHNTL